MIWAHESQIDIGRAVITVGWDVSGEDYEGSLFEPPTKCEPDWEQISHDEIVLTKAEQRMVFNALWAEMKTMEKEIA